MEASEMPDSPTFVIFWKRETYWSSTILGLPRGGLLAAVPPVGELRLSF
jgi:hypothetical protein